MAYIPTIHTFEDDINENRGFDQAPITGGIESLTNKNSILVAEKSPSSLSKKILSFIAVLFILGSVGVVGYYFYNQWSLKKEQTRLNTEATAKQAELAKQQNLGVENDLAKIFPLLAPGIKNYVASAVKKNNIVILTLNDNALNGIDNYSSIYGYILAHRKDLNNDLFLAFDMQNLISSLASEQGLAEAYNSNNSEATTTPQIASTTNSFISKPIPLSANDLTWETKTLENQTFEVTNAGILTLVYGYLGHGYAIFTTSLKDYFDTVNSLK